jgi:hypothetical protein
MSRNEVQVALQKVKGREDLDHGLAHDVHQRLALEARGLVARRDDAHHARPALGPRVEPVTVCGCCNGDGAHSHRRVHQPRCPRRAAAHHTLAAHFYAWYSLHTPTSQFSQPHNLNHTPNLHKTPKTPHQTTNLHKNSSHQHQNSPPNKLSKSFQDTVINPPVVPEWEA